LYELARQYPINNSLNPIKFINIEARKIQRLQESRKIESGCYMDFVTCSGQYDPNIFIYGGERKRFSSSNKVALKG